MQKEIKQLAETGEDYFHIIFCSNNLFLTNQTATRINETYTELAKNLKAVVFHSHNKKCHKMEQLMMKISSHRAILCCSHKSRFEQMGVLLHCGLFTNKKVIIWIDEMHMDLNMILKHILPISLNPSVVKIVGISATPDNIFKKIGNKDFKIKIKPMDACDKSKYYGFDDCKKIIINIEDYTIPEEFYENSGYLARGALVEGGNRALSSKIENALYLNTLLMNDEINYDNDDVFFVPGSRYIVSHEAIKDVLIDHGFYVFVFNSNGCHLYFELGESIDLKQEKALEEATNGFQCSLGSLMGIAKKLYKLDDRPIAITGYLSVGQGNTLCDWDTSFYVTKGIFGYKKATTDFTTQVTGRIFGNMKDREDFNGCEMIMRSTFREQVEDNILSGAYSEYALEMNITELSFRDLPQTKRIMKVGLKDKFRSIKQRNRVTKNRVNYIPFQFTLPKKLTLKMINAPKGTKLTKSFMRYFKKGKIDCEKLEELLGDGEEGDYVIKQCWRVKDASTKDELSKWNKIENANIRQKKDGTFITPAYLKNHPKTLFIAIDIRNEQGLCYGVYSEMK